MVSKSIEFDPSAVIADATARHLGLADLDKAASVRAGIMLAGGLWSARAFLGTLLFRDRGLAIVAAGTKLMAKKAEKLRRELGATKVTGTLTFVFDVEAMPSFGTRQVNFEVRIADIAQSKRERDGRNVLATSLANQIALYYAACTGKPPPRGSSVGTAYSAFGAEIMRSVGLGDAPRLLREAAARFGRNARNSAR